MFTRKYYHIMVFRHINYHINAFTRKYYHIKVFVLTGCHYLMLFTIELFDFLFMAMINNSILTSATRSASCDRGAPNPQGQSSGERNRNNEEVVQVFTRKYYHIMVFRHINYHINAFTRKYYHIKVFVITGCHYLMLFTIELFDFLFMAMINTSFLTSATRSASCDRGAPNPQGQSSGERNRNNEEVVQVFTRKYYHIMVFRHINYHINAFTRKYYHIKVFVITGCHYLMLFTIELFDFLFMAMINTSFLTSATRSASCDRGAPNPQGQSSGERNRNNEEVVQVFTRKYYHIMVFRHINYHINAFTRKYYHIKVFVITGCHYLMLFTIELFDFLFMAMINTSFLTSATRSASCDRGAPNPQGRSYGERSRNNEEVVQAFTRIII